MPKTKQLALAGLLLAVLILFERFIAIDTVFLRISFAYVPYMLASWLLGPVWTAVIGASGDLLGMLLMPKASFFPGFTLNAVLTGLIYGVCLHNKKPDRRFCVALGVSLVAVHVFIHLGLTTLWLSILYKKAFLAILTGRIIANAIEVPIEFASMLLLTRFLEKPVNLYLKTESAEDDAGETGGGEDSSAG